MTYTNLSVLDLTLIYYSPKFINQAESELKIKLRISQGLRTFDEQNLLYEKGRTNPGDIVTNAKGGQSYYNYGLAIDVVEIRNGDSICNANWPDISKIFISQGFEWGGNFKNLPDKPHFSDDIWLFNYGITEFI